MISNNNYNLINNPMPFSNVGRSRNINRRIHAPKKVIFSEPYENASNFYIDNNFKKGDCEYCQKRQANSNQPPIMNLPILPFFSSFLNNGGGINNILGMLGGKNGNSNLGNVLTNPDFLSSVTNLLFKNNTKATAKEVTRVDDFDLKDYTKVE